MSRRPFLLSLAAIAALAGTPAFAQGGPVKIGGLTFLTGKFASYGAEYASGMKLGVDYVNAHGGVLGGRKLQLELQDTASDSAQAATLLRRLAADQDIVGVVGPTGTPDFLAILPIARSLGDLPIITQASAKFDQAQFPDNVVRVYLVENPDLLKWYFGELQKAKGIKRVAFLTDRSNDAQANSRRNEMEGIKGTGIEVVGDEYIRAGDRDFAAVIDKLLAGKPDTMVVNATTNEATLFLTQARARGFKGLFVGTAGLADPKIGELAKQSAAGAITMLPLDVNAPSPLVKSFVAAYKGANGDKSIAPFAAYTFDSVLLLADAINRAGSTDRAKVMKALGSTKDFHGVTSTFTFRGKGDNITQTPHLVEFTATGAFRPFK
jgi:branched-chain amino acid transport system substrate-binding protein